MGLIRLCKLSVFATLLIAFFGLDSQAQKATEQWLRVITGEDSIIEVDRTSLILEPNDTIRASFKTSSIAQESVPGRPDLHFQTRIDQIQFDLKNNRYRVANSTFLNAKSEKIFASSPNGETDWKWISGTTSRKLRNAAALLAPFGAWNISSYRYPLGGSPSENDPPELKSLIGTQLRIILFGTVKGPTVCSVRNFELFSVDNEQSTRLFGASLTDLKIPAAKVEAIRFKCTFPNATPQEAVMLILTSNKALILWDGVFLETERPGNEFLPY